MCLCDTIFHTITYPTTMYVKNRIAPMYFRHAWSDFFQNRVPIEHVMFLFNEHPPLPDEILLNFIQENVT